MVAEPVEVRPALGPWPWPRPSASLRTGFDTFSANVWCDSCQSFRRRRRRALLITETEERLMAAAAIIGERSVPKRG